MASGALACTSQGSSSPVTRPGATASIHIAQPASTGTRSSGPHGGSSLPSIADTQSIEQTISMLSELHRTNSALDLNVAELLKRAKAIEDKAERLKQAWLMERSRRERAQTWFTNFRERAPVLDFSKIFLRGRTVLVVHDDENGRFVEELDAVTIDKPEYADLVHWHLYDAESDDEGEEGSNNTAGALSGVQGPANPSPKEPAKMATDIARENGTLSNAKPHLAEKHMRPHLSYGQAARGQSRGQKRTAAQIDNLILSAETRRIRRRVKVQQEGSKKSTATQQEKGQELPESTSAHRTAAANNLNGQCSPPPKATPQDSSKTTPSQSSVNEDGFVSRARQIFRMFPFTRPDPLASPPPGGWPRQGDNGLIQSGLGRMQTPTASEWALMQAEPPSALQNEQPRARPARRQDISFLVDLMTFISSSHCMTRSKKIVRSLQSVADGSWVGRKSRARCLHLRVDSPSLSIKLKQLYLGQT